jgi:hypothetical protein
LIVLAAPSAANATISSVFGTVTCTEQISGATAGQRWCGNSAGTTVSSFDGTPIDVAVGFPVATGSDKNYPLVGIYHGWGGTKITPSSATAQRWLTKGYAVFSISDRGWGSSCGKPSSPPNTEKAPPCQKGYIHLMSRAYEVRDVQTLLGKLADEGVIDPNHIGANGGSYGGGMSLQLGALKDRVELPNHELIPWESPLGKPMKIAATAPEFPWTDLSQALQPNGSGLDYVANAPYKGMLNDHRFGIEKNFWSGQLYLAGALLGYYGPESDPEANLTGWHNFNTKGGPYDGEPLAIQQEEQLQYHSPYYTSLSEPPAPSIMENGWNDDLFPVDETVRYYNKVRATYPNQAMKLFYMDLGHNPRSAQSLSASDVGKFQAAQNEWFAYYLKGEGSEPAGVHGGVTTITSPCPAGTSGVEHKASNWASLAPGEISFASAAEQTIQSPGTAPANAFQAEKVTVCTTQTPGDNATAATYKLPAAPESGFTLAGSPTVIAEFSTPGANDQVAARLYDVSEGGTGTQLLIGRQAYRPLNPGEGFTKQIFQLHPQAWKVNFGHVLKLELLTADSPYLRNSSSPHAVQVRNLELRVPTIDPPGSAEGMVQAPQPKYLPNGYTLARNVPTTVPGVPFISSGGTPNTGVFTLAWEPSEAGVAVTYTLQHKPAEGGSWTTVASGLTSPEYAFTSGSKEEEGVWVYRVSASNESPESGFSAESASVKVDRSPPVAVTEPASAISQTSATLNATVNPKDQNVTSCTFEYGTTTAYGLSMPCSSLPGAGEAPVAVSASLTAGSLSENTTYHYRIVAVNVNGTGFGEDKSFTTLPNRPAVVTDEASSVTESSAQLNATVNPEGGTVTSCRFEYGTTEAYGLSAACTASPGSGETPVPVSASVAGLTASTTYHYRIVATNAGGTSNGADVTFTTLAPPAPLHWYRGGAKVKQGLSVPVVIWGGSVQTSQLGEISCSTVGGASVENPQGGGTGSGEIQALMFYACKAPQCEAQVKEKFGTTGRALVGVGNLPWSTELQEGGSPRTGRERIGKPFSLPFGSPSAGEIKLTSSCEVVSTHMVVSTSTFEGELTPEIGAAGSESLNGTGASHPSVLRFSPTGGGRLHSEGGEASYSGTPKYLGYGSQEVLGVGA